MSRTDSDENVEALRERIQDLSQAVQEDTAFLRRNLRAREGVIENAEKLLRDTLAWRQEYRPDTITPLQIKSEIETLKMFPYGHDKKGRSIVFCTVALHNPKERDYEMCVKCAIYCVEQAVRSLPEGVEQFVGVVDCAGIRHANADLALCQEIFRYLDFYAERFGGSFVINTNWVFTLLYRMLKVFMPKATQEKIRVIDVKDLPEYFSPENMLEAHGGTINPQKVVAEILARSGANDIQISSPKNTTDDDDDDDEDEPKNERDILDGLYTQAKELEEQQTKQKGGSSLLQNSPLTLSSANIAHFAETEMHYTPKKKEVKKKKKEPRREKTVDSTTPRSTKQPRIKVTSDELIDKSEGALSKSSQEPEKKRVKKAKTLSEEDADEGKIKKPKKSTDKSSERSSTSVTGPGPASAESSVDAKKKVKVEVKPKKKPNTLSSEDLSSEYSSSTRSNPPLTKAPKGSSISRPSSTSNQTDSTTSTASNAESNASVSETIPLPVLEVIPPSPVLLLPATGQTSSSDFSLKNINKVPVVFSVRTGSLKPCTIEPSCGHLTPGQTAKLIVTFKETLSSSSLKIQVKTTPLDKADQKLLEQGDLKANIAKFLKGLDPALINKYVIQCKLTLSSPQGPESATSLPNPKGADATISSSPSNTTSTTSTTSVSTTRTPKPAASAVTSPSIPPPTTKGGDDVSAELLQHRETVFAYKRELESLKKRIDESSKKKELMNKGWVLVFLVGIIVGVLVHGVVF